MKYQSIAFIGAGNMARSLIGGLITGGYDPARISASDSDETALRLLQQRSGIKTHADNARAAQTAGVVVIAVKPQVVPVVTRELAHDLRGSDKLVISIAAGISTSALKTWLGGDIAVVRAMPNTPALVQSGATALFANTRVTGAQREAAESILRAVGLTLWLDDERHMDAVTALSGSGPAYFFLVMEAMEQAGCRLGLPPETARLLTIETAFGAAKMALESTDSSPGDLRAQVTSPGGTTEQAIAVLQQGNLQGLFEQALARAHARSIELSKLLGENKQ